MGIKRKRIAAILNNIEGKYQIQMMAAMQEYARTKQVRMLIFGGRSLDSPYPEDHLHNLVLTMVKTSDCEGVLAVAGAMGTNSTDEQLAAHLKNMADVPMVTLGRLVPGFKGTRTENTTGIISAIEHLVKVHGLKRMGFLSGPMNDPDSMERLAAFRQGLQEFNLPVLDDQVYFGDFSFRSVVEVVKTLTKQKALTIQAMICANDEMALALQTMLREAGYRVPHDIAVIGFDNVLDAGLSSPALSTVSQQLYKQTLLAGELLLDSIEGVGDTASVELPCSFVVRESCGCSAVHGPQSRQMEALHEAGDEKIHVRSDAHRIVAELMASGHLSFETRNDLERMIPSLLDSIHLDLRSLRDPPLFLLSLHEWLEITFAWDNYSEQWNRLLSQLRQICTNHKLDSRDGQYLSGLFHEAYGMLARRTTQLQNRNNVENQEVQRRLMDLSRKINGANSLGHVLEALGEAFPLFGINKSVIVRTAHNNYEPDNEQVWHFQPLVGMSAGIDSMQLSAHGIVPMIPREWLDDFDGLSTIVLPLVSHDYFFGYVVMSGDRVNPATISILQDETSHALYVNHLAREREQNEAMRLEAQEAQQQSQERFYEMAMMVPMLMWETDQLLTLRFLNQAAKDSLGLDLGGSLRSLLGSEERQHVDGILIKGGLVKHPGIKIRRQDGRGQILVQQLSVITNDGGVRTGLRWYALDPMPLMVDSIFPDQSFFKEYLISEREKDILLLLVQGYKAKEIGDILSIAESTVKGHTSHLYDKFGVDSRTGLVDHLSRYQVKQHGYGTYLFTVLNHLLSSSFHT